MDFAFSLENATFHSELLIKTIDNYIPAPLLKNAEQAIQYLNSLQPLGINLKQVLQSFLDKSDNKLKMFGTVDDLLTDLKIYQKFPLNHKMFGIAGHTMEATLDYQKEPVKYKSLRGELFYNKHDFLHHLYSRIHTKYAANMSGSSPEVLECMKRNEKKLDGCYEFFRCDHVTLPEVQQMLLKLFNNLHDKGVPLATQTGMDSHFRNVFSQIMQNVNSAIPANSEEKKSDAELLQKIIDSYPHMFLPNAELLNRSSASIVVRIFEDVGQKFVMKSELFKDDRISSSNESFQTLKDENGIIWTIDANEVFKTLGGKIGFIEFISVPIQRAKHAAVPIATPSGDHCILASDAVSELLRRLISALKVFQNLNTNDWQAVTQYIDLLNTVFPLNATHKFFIDTSKFEKFKCKTDDFWAKIQTDSSKKVVRDVGIYGFDVEFLKEELKILELSTAFPDIIDKAEIAYQYVFKMRRGPTLETSDLIDAVEVCQLICLLEKFPQLKEFFHNQNYCNRIPSVQCNQCSSPPPRFPTLMPWSDTSDLKEIHEQHVVLRFPRGLINAREIDWNLDLPNFKTITTNLKCLSFDQFSKLSPKFFLVDLDDLKHIKTDQFEEFMLNEESFLKYHPNKKMYIRTVPIALTLYVFTDDVLEICSTLLKQQNVSIKVINDRLKKYRRTWKKEEEHFYKLIGLDEFKSILKELKVNEQLITIVPDMVYNRTQFRMSDASATDVAEVFSPDGKRVIDSSQAVFYIFQRTVCGVNWKLECCKTHPECRDNYKKRVINLMRKYADMKEGTLVLLGHVMDNVTALRNHCTYKQQAQLRLPEYLLYNYHPTQLIYLSLYYSIADAYGLRRHEFHSNGPNPVTNIWTYRAVYIAGWAEAFFSEPELDDLSIIIQRTVINVIPNDIVMKEQKTLSAILNLTFNPPNRTINQVKPVEKETKKCEVSKASSSNSKVTKTTDLGEKKKEVVSSEDVRDLRVQEVPKSPITEEISEKPLIKSTNQNEKESKKDLELADLYDKNVDDLKKKLAEAEKRLEMTEKKKALEMKKQMEKYEKMTSKCECLELRIKELEEENAAEIQEQVEKYEQKVKKYEELEKKSKETERGMKENEKKMKELEMKKDKELDEYKTKMIKSDEAKDKRIRILCKNALDSTKEIKKLKSTVTKIEAENVKMKKENNQFVQKLAQKPNGLEGKEKQISEKNRIIKELKEANRKMLLEKEATRKVIQDTISMSSTQLQMLQRLLTNSPSSETTSETAPIENRETSDSFETQLRNLQRHRDWMSDKKEIEPVKDMVKRLVSLSNRPDIHLFANYELQKYEGNIQNYLQAVEVNIKKLQESADVSKLPPLPEIPQLSVKFVSELWSEVDRARAHEVKDSECYICSDEMKENEKTLECRHCKKITHWECASKWLKSKQTCAHCRQKQLDPNEYPDLPNNFSS
ncbi:hypothetical protein GCK72_011003 [Caenorhabditis remanei]|uniref:RING-type domain-containing protein n=1 Tax=Caenorhabditis remanei TaxID=31234 RepID=A0A6A5H778_CAERE|nr:hypothetical protein GCK72_011003 [Caenorhabditis remanei]KAF1762741.1 hypothetical protein GCK72_011003 [Caenorhabditis remanei]